jgi:hypothetical protein
LPRFASRLVIAAAIGLLTAAAPASAAWEDPQRLDQTSEGFDHSSQGDVAAGDNGLATIMFFQADDDGSKLYATRRAADAASWLAPQVVSPRPDGPFAIAAAPDGSTAGGYRQEGEAEGEGPPVPVGGDDTVQNVFGLGWLGNVQDPKTADLGDQGSEELPRVDVDGRGNAWTAFVEADMTLKIVRFDLSEPGKTPTEFPLDPVAPDPTDQHGDETDSRTNPRVDVNADGDVVVTFVEARREFNQDAGLQPPVDRVYAMRKLYGTNAFTGPFLISHEGDTEAVNRHDPAIVDGGDITVLFAADPDRNTAEPNTTGPNRLFARRWLATGEGPRPEGRIEFVSSSEPDAPDVSQPQAETGPGVRVTAAWLQGASQLNAAERTTTWTVPQTLSSNTAAFDVAVDTDGVATAVYRESTTVKARRRAPDQQWAEAETISSAPASADVAPRVDAGAPLQADAYFVQNDGAARRGAFATRFRGVPPDEDPAPVRPDTEDCPNDIEVLFGDGGANSIDGTEARETILGGEGDDTLSGNGGDDCLRGGGGNDAAHGGSGNDDVGGGEGDDRLTGGEGNDRLGGGGGADSLNGNAGDDVGFGGDGNDTVDGSDGVDALTGDAGDDTVSGGTGNDLLAGADGNDTVYGQAGKNVLAGGLGDDRLVGGPDTDTVLGEQGDDNVSGGNGPDNVSGGDGNDRVRGGNGRNVLDGGVGDDGMRGGGQSDRMLGGDGVDNLFGLAGRDRLLGGADADKAYGGAGNDRLFGNAARDRLRGGNGADRLKGGSGKDSLFGESGKDRLSGGAGGDVLNPGSSRDRVFGGGGSDRIATVDNKRDNVNCGAGRDRVVADAVDRVNRNCERVRRRD